MIHPYQGYLAFFQGKDFRFEDLMEVYENQVAASFERTNGRDLLADELSCLSFWNVKYSKNPYLNWKEMNSLLTAYRFQLNDEEDFKFEFKFLLSQSRGEFRLDHSEHVYRFDLARQIFLERGL